MNKRLLKLGILGLLAVYLQLLSVVIHAERLPVRIYTSADGLGSSFIDYLMRDSRGFMWFCTRDGLSRFDGSRFVTYRVGDKNSPPGIESIFETRDGTYWLSTTNGTYRFDSNTVSLSDAVAPRLAAEHIGPGRGLFFEDSRGTLWSNISGLSRLTTQDGKTVFEKVDPNLQPTASVRFFVRDFAESPDTSLWLNSSWGLVRFLPDGRKVYYPYKDGEGFDYTSMLVDQNERVWLTTARHIFVLKPESLDALSDAGELTVKPLQATSTVDLTAGHPAPMPKITGEIVQYADKSLSGFVEKSYIRRMYQTADGDVWITAEDHLLQFSHGSYILHSGDEGLPNVMARMAEDNAGNLWIAGQTSLARLDRGGLATFGKLDGANSNRFFAISEDPEGGIYVAGRDFYLSHFVDGRLETFRPTVEPNSNYLWTSRFALRSSTGDWWILTDQKLYRYAAAADFGSLAGKQPTRTYTMDDGLKGNAMFQIFEDSAGDIWVSTRDDFITTRTGLARLKKGEDRFHAFSESDGLPDGVAFSSAAEDANGNIWFGFYTGGLARFDGERFEYWDQEDGLPPSFAPLPDLLLDRSRRLWIASVTNGLIRIDDTKAKQPTFTYVSTSEGLSSNNIRTITEDKFGRIYAGTARGIDRLSPDTGHVRHYSVSDGLAADFVVDSHCDKDGTLWFATGSGISRLVPQPADKITAPQIFLGGLRVAGEPRPISLLGTTGIDTGDLSSNQDNLQFDFFGLDFRAGEALRYQYKLEGADTDWSPPTDLNTVTFAHLKAGDYQFLVRAVNSEGAVSTAPATVRFTILSPIYARWWFVALCCLVALGLVIALERYRAARNLELARVRLQRLAELEQVRARIATDLHDDIGASLTEIAILSEVARQQQIAAPTNGKGTSEPLEMIYSVSNELVSTMSDIVWAINPQKDQLHDLTLRMRRYASDILTAKDIDLEFEAPEDIEDFSLNSNLRREVFLIFKESINNIVKHSGATKVDVEFRVEGNELFITVQDNGRGFEVYRSETGSYRVNSDGELIPQSYGGNGLQNMKRRAAEMGGEFEISSEAGQGSVVRLRLPIAIRLDSDFAQNAG